jgi:hypothetical protein
MGNLFNGCFYDKIFWNPVCAGMAVVMTQPMGEEFDENCFFEEDSYRCTITYPNGKARSFNTETGQ